MPTASVAGAAKHGHVLPSAVLGRAPSAGRKKDKGKENGPGSTPSFPPPPRDPKKQHIRGRGQPPASSMASLSAPPEDPPEDEDSALNANNWGASDPAIFAQLERELGSLRDQLALRQQISGARRRLMEVPHSGTARGEAVRDGHIDPAIAFSDRELDALSMTSLSGLAAPPPPIDKEEARLAKRVATFEATIVRKLIARTPSGPTGVGAQKVLNKAFEYYDTEGDGEVDVASFTRVLAKLNVVSSLPPSDAEREVIGALFVKYTKGSPSGELAYGPFARNLLYSAGVLVPAAEAMEKNQRDRWQYSTAVRQVMDRRYLGTTRDEPANPACASEEWEAAIQPRKSDAEGASLRGRSAAGLAGWAEAKRMAAARGKRVAEAQRAEAEKWEGDRDNERRRFEDRVRDARTGWAKINEQNRELRNRTPGQARADARRGTAVRGGWA